jgi:hypothetical protein
MVYHEMLKTEKVLGTMSLDYDFITKATLDAQDAVWVRTHVYSKKN